MDSHGDIFFNSLLQGRSNLDKQFMESQYMTQASEMASQESEFSPAMETVTKKPRGVNFTIEEDNMLVSAWLNTSLDPIRRNDQKEKTFWQRVTECFHENKKFVSDRNDNSLMNRWSTIQLSTNKFCGYFAQIESRNQSGLTEQDKIVDAKQMYQKFQATSFPFEHCWNVLRNQPKWFEELQKKKPKRRRNATTSSPPLETINLADDDVTPDPPDDLERPICTKAAKEHSKKMKSTDSASSPIEKILTVMHEEKKKDMKKKVELLEKSYRIQEERTQMEKQREEERIMLMDTTGMAPLQQEYYFQRQREIVESRRTRNTLE